MACGLTAASWCPDATPAAVGDVFRNRDLALALRRIASGVAAAF